MTYEANEMHNTASSGSINLTCVVCLLLRAAVLMTSNAIYKIKKNLNSNLIFLQL